MRSAVVLINPKTPYNVGGVIRACSIFGAGEMWWTGERVHDDRRLAGSSRQNTRKWRLPREERMKAYRDVRWGVDEGALDRLVAAGLSPVCVEVTDQAERLPDFVHPPDAVYVFGPEDGSVPKGVRIACHRFVVIPARSCLNLAAAVNVVLYDRTAKAQQAEADLAVAVARG